MDITNKIDIAHSTQQQIEYTKRDQWHVEFEVGGQWSTAARHIKSIDRNSCNSLGPNQTTMNITLADDASNEVAKFVISRMNNQLTPNDPGFTILLDVLNSKGHIVRREYYTDVIIESAYQPHLSAIDNTLCEWQLHLIYNSGSIDWFTE